MALTDKDLLEAIAKLKERNAQQAKPTERMSLEEFHQMYGGPAVPAEAVQEKSARVLEAQEDIASSVTSAHGDGLNANATKIVNEIQKTNESLQKLGNIIREQTKEQSDAIAEIASNVEITLSPLEKMTQTIYKIRENISPRNIKETLLTGLASKFKGVPLLGGVMQRAKEKETWIKTQMKVDPSLTRQQLSEEWKPYKESAKQVKRASSEYEETRKMLGMGDSAFAKTPIGKQLMEKQKAATKQFARYERRASYVAGEDEVEALDPRKHSTRKDVDASASAEKDEEAKKTFEDQTHLLKTIADNTDASKEPKQPTKETTGGNWLSKLGGIGRTLGDSSKGLLALGASLWIVSKAFDNFAQLNWDGLTKGLVALGGLVVAAKLLETVTGSMIKGAVGIAALGGALMLSSAGFEAFAAVDWESIAKAGVAIAGLSAIAAGIGTFVAPILLGTAAIAALGASVWVLAKGLDAVSESFNKIKGGGSTADSASTAKAEGTTPARVTTNRPAGANMVYGASAENATAATVSGGGVNNNVVAPTINNTRNETVTYRSDVRNQDSSFKRMLDNRYVAV